ncbi:MAG: hypothetical protein WA921_12145 [Ahrensia sp.]
MGKERTIIQLRRKLGLLVEYEHYADLTAIANAIGTKLKTMESWADTGTDKATPGLVSTKQYPNLIRIFEHAIAKNHLGVDVEKLLHGSVSDLEQWLKPLPLTGILALLTRDADFSSGKLFVEKSKPVSAVARRSELTPTTARVVTTSDWFRIEFPSVIKTGNVIAMQRCRRQWAFCPIHGEAGSSIMAIPGFDQHGQPDWLQETEWIGVNHFYVLELFDPWPSGIQQALDEGVPISAELLSRIAETYEAQSPQFRAVYAIEIGTAEAKLI